MLRISKFYFILLGINIALVSGGGQLDCVHGNSVIHCQV